MISQLSLEQWASSTHCIEDWMDSWASLDIVVRRIIHMLKEVSSWLFSLWPMTILSYPTYKYTITYIKVAVVKTINQQQDCKTIVYENLKCMKYNMTASSSSINLSMYLCLLMKGAAFWSIMPCGLVDIYWHFGGISTVRFKKQAKQVASIASSNQRWRQHVPMNVNKNLLGSMV
jgi:hypothetical protein